MTDFKTLQKLKTAISNCDFNCKLILNKGIYAQLPDGYLIDLKTYTFMQTSTLTTVHFQIIAPNTVEQSIWREEL